MNRTLSLWLAFSLIAQSAYISIIIDDMGDNYALGLQALELPKEVAMSILPRRPHSQTFAHSAHQKGMDVLLHQPMQSIEHNHLLGTGALLEDMNQLEFLSVLRHNLAQMPHVVGLNNHMGSELTSNPQAMHWLMSELKNQGLFFIDSRTSAQTVALDEANQLKIPALRRRVFLDHVDELSAIEASLLRLVAQAKQYGHAIAIGHPRKNTLQALKNFLPKLAEHQVQLISLSDYFALQQLESEQLASSDSSDQLQLNEGKTNKPLPLQLTEPCWALSLACEFINTKDNP